MMGEKLEIFNFKWREDYCSVPASEQQNCTQLRWNGDRICFEGI